MFRVLMYGRTAPPVRAHRAARSRAKPTAPANDRRVSPAPLIHVALGQPPSAAAAGTGASDDTTAAVTTETAGAAQRILLIVVPFVMSRRGRPGRGSARRRRPLAWTGSR